MNSAAAGSFSDHPRKIHFRKNWAKPILNYLTRRLGKKLVYLGLPGIRALDILEWQEFLRVVIAFQAENYDGRQADLDAEEELNNLKKVLNELEQRSVIDTYALYTGYIEEVVMEELDNNLDPFVINDYVTIYNLDFCNTLSKPHLVVTKNYETYDCYKIDVIDKLLKIERDKFESGQNACFVMFLTVSESFQDRMVSTIDDPTIREYISNNLKGVVKEKRGVRLLKAYAFYKLTQIFQNNGFHIEFLPTIYYQGSGQYFDKSTQSNRPFWLSTFTIIGTPFDLNTPTANFQQDFMEFLQRKFVFIGNQGISCYTDKDKRIRENDFNPSIEDILSKCDTFQKLWK